MSKKNNVPSFDSIRFGSTRVGIKDTHNSGNNNNSGSISSSNYPRKSPSIVELQNLQMDVNGGYEIPRYSSDQCFGKNNGRVKNSSSKTGQRKKTKVYVTVVFLKVGQIETIQEYYEADVFIQSRWREPSLDGVVVDGTDFKPPWTPQLKVQNMFADPKETAGYKVQYAANDEAFVYELRRVKGKFEERMELNDFPFDVQSLSLLVTSELTLDAVQILEDPREISTIHTECFSDSQEWRLYNFVELRDTPISAEFSVARNNYPGITASCNVSRMSGFFAWNVLVIMNFLNIFGFTTFAVDPKLTPNRLQLSFILVLAAISFRFVTNQSMPKISYLTHLDRYVLLSMAFSGSITIWHAVVSRFSEDLQDDIDFGAFIVFAVSYFIFQCVFIFYTALHRRTKVKEIRAKEEKYKLRSYNVRQSRNTSSTIPMHGNGH